MCGSLRGGEKKAMDNYPSCKTIKTPKILTPERQVMELSLTFQKYL
jgi:hypothetical protein